MLTARTRKLQTVLVSLWFVVVVVFFFFYSTNCEIQMKNTSSPSEFQRMVFQMVSSS